MYRQWCQSTLNHPGTVTLAIVCTHCRVLPVTFIMAPSVPMDSLLCISLGPGFAIAYQVMVVTIHVQQHSVSGLRRPLPDFQTGLVTTITNFLPQDFYKCQGF